MLNREEKIKKFDKFIRSKEFGIDTWMTIHLFKNNCRYVLTTLKLYGILIKRLDEGNIPNTLSSMDKVVVKQFILLDVIMKLEILIESTFVLIHALSKDRNSVPRLMVYYDMNLIGTVIDKIKNRKLNMEKTIGLLKISRLPLLSNEEKKYLVNDYAEIVEKIYKKLDTLAEFYENFRLIYGKTKHGLTVDPGLNLIAEPNTPEQPNHDIQFEDSLLIGHDIKRKKDLPSGYFVSWNKVNTEEGEFFNTLTCVKFNKEFIDNVTKIISILEELIPYICENHMTFAQNCGESYMPYFHDHKNGKVGLIFSKTNSTEKEVIKMRNEITKKIIPIMNINDIDLTTKTTFANPAIINSIKNNIVTNIWKPFVKK